MIIDAKIRGTARTDAGLRLWLAPRWDGRTQRYSTPGQAALLIVDPVIWEPPAGLVVRGSGEEVAIVVGEREIPYERVGYEHLRETDRTRELLATLVGAGSVVKEEQYAGEHDRGDIDNTAAQADAPTVSNPGSRP